MKTLFDRLWLIVTFKVVVKFLHLRKRFFSAVKPGVEHANEMVNVGGGLFFRPHWKVLDHVSPFYPFGGRFIDYDVDLMDGEQFPHADDSVAIFYSSHTLEHIPQERCQHILDEMYRCLRPGGVVRLTMPDYDRMRRAVSDGDKIFFAKHVARGLLLEEGVIYQIATAAVGLESADEVKRRYKSMTAQEFADHYCDQASRETQKKMGGYHINWFNFDKLAEMMRAAGFTEIHRSAPQASKCPHLVGKGGFLALGNLFDTQRRLGIDTSHPDLSLYVEAVK